MEKVHSMKKISILLTLCVAAAGVAYLAASRQGAIKDMTVRPLGGVVTLVRDGEEKSVKGDSALRPGDVVVTTESGRATVKLEGGRQAWMLGSSEVAVVNGSSLESRRGDLRTRASNAEMTVEFDGIVATARDAHFRIDQGFGSARAASYSGKVHLAKPGAPRLLLDGLFEAEVAAADLPTSTRPYRFDIADEWDTQILEDVIALDEDLSQLGQGLASQLGRQRPPLGYFRELAGRKVGFMKSYLKQPTEDLLIGFIVADNSKVDNLKRSFEMAMGYRDGGGRWGVVASILEAKPNALVSDLKRVIVATGAGGGGGQTQPEFTVASAADASGGGSDDGGTLGSPDKPDGGDEGGKDPKGGDDPGDSDDCEEGLDCDIKDLQDQLPGGGDPSPTPTEPPKGGGGSITTGVLDDTL